MAITERGKAGGGKGQTMDYMIVHGQTEGLSKYRCETLCLKDFEVVKSWRGDVVGPNPKPPFLRRTEFR